MISCIHSIKIHNMHEDDTKRIIVFEYEKINLVMSGNVW